MVETLLRLRYSAGDPVAATGAIRAVLGAARVATRGSLEWEQTSLVDDGITVSSIRSRGDSVHLVVPGASELIVVLVKGGEAVLSTGGEQLRLAPRGSA